MADDVENSPLKNNFNRAVVFKSQPEGQYGPEENFYLALGGGGGWSTY